MSNLEPYQLHDPIHEKNGLWYFWDETWADVIGPYPNEETARAGLNQYVLWLDGQLPGQGKPQNISTV